MAIWIQSGRGGGGERPRDLGRFRLATHRLLTCNLELNVGEATHGHRGESTRSCYQPGNSVTTNLTKCMLSRAWHDLRFLLQLYAIIGRLSNASPPPKP